MVKELCPSPPHLVLGCHQQSFPRPRLLVLLWLCCYVRVRWGYKWHHSALIPFRQEKEKQQRSQEQDQKVSSQLNSWGWGLVSCPILWCRNFLRALCLSQNDLERWLVSLAAGSMESTWMKKLREKGCFLTAFFFPWGFHWHKGISLK